MPPPSPIESEGEDSEFARRDAGRGLVGITVGFAGWVGAFRNVTAVVDPIAQVNNYLLTLWLIVLGVILIRWRAAAAVQQGALG
jgi:hypothetical protein